MSAKPIKKSPIPGLKKLREEAKRMINEHVPLVHPKDVHNSSWGHKHIKKNDKS